MQATHIQTILLMGVVTVTRRIIVLIIINSNNNKYMETAVIRITGPVV